MRTLSAVVAAVVAVATAAIVWWLWWRPPAAPPTGAAAPEPVVVAPAAPATESPVAASAPVPFAPSAGEGDGPPLPADDASVQQALVELLGRDAVFALLRTDAFAERLVATIDNLPRGHAAPRLWPVHPTPGRFAVDADGRIAPANAARYDAFVGLVEGVDPAAAAALYRRLLPQMQAAYEHLGYPGRSVHARVLEVIDHLLATPSAAWPPQVTLTDVRGPIPSQRPWVRYEFADAGLETLSAGQKILLRVGPQHQRRLSDWLRALRAQIAR